MDALSPVKLDGYDAACALFGPLLADAVRERLVVAHIDDKTHVVRVQTFEGDPMHVGLPIREIVAVALGADAVALALAHNHPSGIGAPTPADIETTRALHRALKPIGIKLRDHLIYAHGEWTSFRELGLI